MLRKFYSPLQKTFLSAWLILSSVLLAATELPDLGEGGTESLSLSQERQIGAQVLWQLRNAHALLEDPIAQDYLQRLGNRLASPKGNVWATPIWFFWINDTSINAFALPGGLIGVHIGLISFAHTENELAAVLAHEIAHVQHRHVAQLYTYMSKMHWQQVASTVAAIVLAMGKNASAATGALTAGVAAQLQSALNFTREHETEADRLGIELLAKAGFSTTAMPLFFEHLAQQQRFQAQIPIFLRSHPFTTDRMQNSARLAKQFTPLAPQDSLAFHLIRTRLETLTLGSTATLKQKWTQEYPKASGLRKIALQYGLARIQSLQGNLQEGLAVMLQLQQAHPEESILSLELAQMYADNQQLSAAIALLKKEAEKPKASSLMRLSLAELWLQNHQADACLKQLRDIKLLEEEPPSSKLYYLRAKAYAALKQPQESALAQAEYLWREGLFLESLTQLEKVIKTTNKGSLYHQRAQARLKELKARLSTKTVDNSVESSNP